MGLERVGKEGEKHRGRKLEVGLREEKRREVRGREADGEDTLGA